MNEQYLGQRINPSNVIEGTDWEKNLPLEKSYTLAEDIPVYGIPVLETPLVETPVVETPLMEPLVVETPATVENPVDVVVLQAAPMDKPILNNAPIAPKDAEAVALINREESDQLRLRWNEIQGKFVDEPRTAVQQADVLVTEVIEQITQMFSTEHSLLENQWKNGEDVSTEDLRNSLKRYRSFFNRLVV